MPWVGTNTNWLQYKWHIDQCSFHHAKCWIRVRSITWVPRQFWMFRFWSRARLLMLAFLLLRDFLQCEVTQGCSYHVTAEIFVANFSCHLKMRHYHIHISLYSYLVIKLLVFIYQTVQFMFITFLSSKIDHNQLHTQATKKCFIQFHIPMFSADLS
jgi:hypothetical protein